jgi:hypothetical protein
MRYSVTIRFVGQSRSYYRRRAIEYDGILWSRWPEQNHAPE